MLDQIIKELKDSPGFLAAHSEILRLISISGFKRFLEERSRARIDVRAPTHTAALQGAHTAGYTDCLLDILNFKERYMDEPISKKPNMDFGMLQVLERQGDLMPEELHAIRTGTDPKYPSPKSSVTEQPKFAGPSSSGSNT